MARIAWHPDALTDIDDIEELEKEGARETIFPPYHIAHRVTDDVVEILKIWHGKQMLRPEEFR